MNGEPAALPAFVLQPACNHNPMRGRIELTATPAYSDQLGPAYLTCIHCGELMGMIEAVHVE